MQAEQVYVEALAAACLATDNPGWESFPPLRAAQQPCIRIDSSSANEAGSSFHFGTYVCDGRLYDYQARHDRCSDI